MDTKKLRQKILDLAIHGKLVPQDPNDEPASVLLERIRAEKERLIKEGKIKRIKKSASDDEIEAPFEIPESWEWIQIKNVCEVARGGSPRPIKDYLTEESFGINWIKIGDATKDGKYIEAAKEKIKPEGVKKSRMVHKGDFLLTNSMSFGRPYILNIDGCIHDGWLVISPHRGSYNSDYLYYLLSSTFAFGQFAGVASGGVVTNLNSDKVADSMFPLPPLAEQKRIINVIERLFSVIDVLESNEGDLLKVIDQTKSKILDLAIHGKLVPQDPNDEPAIEILKRINPKFEPCDDKFDDSQISEKWCFCKIGDIANIIGGVSYQKDDIKTSGIRVLRGGNIQDGIIVSSEDNVFIADTYYNEDNIVKKGDIVVVASTGSSVLIGKTGFATNDIPHTQIGAFLRIVRPSKHVSQNYLNAVFLSNYYKTYIRNIAKGSNINNIKNSHLSDFEITLPPYQEQLRIVSKIEELFAVLDSIKESLS